MTATEQESFFERAAALEFPWVTDGQGRDYEHRSGWLRFAEPHRQFMPDAARRIDEQLTGYERALERRMPPSQPKPMVDPDAPDPTGDRVRAEMLRDAAEIEKRLGSTQYTNQLLERVAAALETLVERAR